MRKEEIRCYDGKRLKILLKNGFVYSCTIKEFFDDCIRITDRFGNLVTISLADISMITEIQEDLRNERY